MRRAERVTSGSQDARSKEWSVKVASVDRTAAAAMSAGSSVMDAAILTELFFAQASYSCVRRGSCQLGRTVSYHPASVSAFCDQQRACCSSATTKAASWIVRSEQTRSL